MRDGGVMPRHVLTKEDMIKGGKKGKRGISFKTEMNKKLNKSPKEIQEVLTAWLEQSKKNPLYAKMIVELMDGLPTQKVETEVTNVNITKKEFKELRKELSKIDDV